MQTEYEATFWPIDKADMRQKLARLEAHREYPERLMHRIAYNLPESKAIGDPSRTWGRVRAEGDQVTMSIKSVTGPNIEDQKEAQVTIDTFENGRAFMDSMGCVEKSYQESKRELWKLDGVEIMIDEWPFLDPFVEIEGVTEEAVRAVAQKLGFDWSEAHFGNVGAFYISKYGITEDRIYNHTPRLVFGDALPFEQ
ncbi:MAG: hypothetical protein V4681_02740 [Patescibacteria group bacterium]